MDVYWLYTASKHVHVNDLLNESKRRAIEPRGWTRYSNGDIHVQSFPQSVDIRASRSSRAATYERERGQLSVHMRLDAHTPRYPTRVQRECSQERNVARCWTNTAAVLRNEVVNTLKQ